MAITGGPDAIEGQIFSRSTLNAPTAKNPQEPLAFLLCPDHLTADS
jgi:hypothetical protein